MKKTKRFLSLIIAMTILMSMPAHVVFAQDLPAMVSSNSIPNGVYYIRNVELEKGYIQIDDNDASNNYATDKVHMELWTYGAEMYQKWNITNLGDGYYSIISMKSNRALSVQSGYENSGNKKIVQETYYGYDRQKWSITVDSNNMVKIKPKSSEAYDTDWVLAAGTSLLSGSDGRNVEQRAYSNDYDYLDMWYLLPSTYTFSQVALANTTGDAYFDNVARYYNVFAHIPGGTYKTMTESDFKYELKNNQIMNIVVHGGEQERSLQLSNNEYFDLSELKAMTQSSISQLELVVLGSCYSGAYSDNFVETFLNKGVEVAIGFVGDVEQTVMLYWMDAFHYYIANGNNVETAINQANSDLIYKYSNTIYESVISGITSGMNYSRSDLSFVPIS